MHRDANCVYVANSEGEADVVAAWLAEQGFPARVMDTRTQGGLPGMASFSPLESDAGGVEVWVLDAAGAPQAKQLLDEHAKTLAQQAAAAAHGEPIVVRCEECGRPSEFPAKDRGSVQECPHCGEYLDVGKSGDHESPDFTSAETDDDDAE